MKNNSKLIFAGLIGIMLFSVLISGCAEQSQRPEIPQETVKLDKAVTEDKALLLAMEYVRNSPTYRFDGSGLEHVNTMVMRCPYCWQFTFEFTSSHSGYGNRSGQVIAQVFTNHTAVVTIVNGRVSSGIIDGKWNIEEQTPFLRPNDDDLAKERQRSM